MRCPWLLDKKTQLLGASLVFKNKTNVFNFLLNILSRDYHRSGEDSCPLQPVSASYSHQTRADLQNVSLSSVTFGAAGLCTRAGWEYGREASKPTARGPWPCSGQTDPPHHISLGADGGSFPTPWWPPFFRDPTAPGLLTSDLYHVGKTQHPTLNLNPVCPAILVYLAAPPRMF